MCGISRSDEGFSYFNDHLVDGFVGKIAGKSEVKFRLADALVRLFEHGKYRRCEGFTKSEREQRNNC